MFRRDGEHTHVILWAYSLKIVLVKHHLHDEGMTKAWQLLNVSRSSLPSRGTWSDEALTAFLSGEVVSLPSLGFVVMIGHAVSHALISAVVRLQKIGQFETKIPNEGPETLHMSRLSEMGSYANPISPRLQPNFILSRFFLQISSVQYAVQYTRAPSKRRFGGWGEVESTDKCLIGRRDWFAL